MWTPITITSFAVSLGVGIDTMYKMGYNVLFLGHKYGSPQAVGVRDSDMIRMFLKVKLQESPDVIDELCQASDAVESSARVFQFGLSPEQQVIVAKFVGKYTSQSKDRLDTHTRSIEATTAARLVAGRRALLARFAGVLSDNAQTLASAETKDPAVLRAGLLACFDHEDDNVVW